jgi:N-acetylneuraminic acid mutarotase
MRHRHKYLLSISVLLFAVLLAAGAATFFIHLRSTYALDQNSTLATGDGRGKWAYAATMPQAFVNFTLTPLHDGRVLLMASDPGTIDSIVSANFVYDPAKDVWTQSAPMPLPVDGYASTVLADGRVIVAGGVDAYSGIGTPNGQYNRPPAPLSGQPPVYSVKTVQIYNPANDTWALAADLPVARVASKAMQLADGSVLLIGSDAVSTLVSTVIYHPASNTWTSGKALQGSTGLYYATLLPNGKVMALIGNPTFNATALQAELYSPDSGMWSSANTGYDGTQVAPVTHLLDGRLVIAGGFQLLNGGIYWSTSKQTQIYHPTTNRWTRGQDLPTTRYFHVLNTLPDGNVLVAGGDSSDSWQNGWFTPTTQIYSAASNTWSSGADMLNGPRNATSIVLANGQVMVAGGLISIVPPTPTPALPTPTPQATSAMGYRIDEMSLNRSQSGPWIQSNLVEIYSTVPGAAKHVHAVAGNGSASVTWNRPVDGGSAITGYVVTASPGGKHVSVGGSATSAKISGLTNGVKYTFSVVAMNALGASPGATSNAVTPAGAPVPTPTSPTGGGGGLYPTPTTGTGNAGDATPTLADATATTDQSQATAPGGNNLAAGASPTGTSDLVSPAIVAGAVGLLVALLAVGLGIVLYRRSQTR